MLNRKLDEAQPTHVSLHQYHIYKVSGTNSPPFQRQIRRPRTRAQTLRSTPYNNRDRRSRTRLEDVRTRLLADTAYPQCHEYIPVERHLKVRGERQEVGFDSWESS